MSEDTRTVRYVGGQLSGVTIDATGDFVRPAGSTLPPPVDPDTGEDVEVSDTADVPADLATLLVRQDIWEPVGWEPPSDDGGDQDEDAGEASDDAGETDAGDADGIGEVPAGTVDEVLAWVDGDPERAAAALETETAGRDRTTLVEELQELTAPEADLTEE